ncbi:MAG: VWA domain-containing protein [Gammaproteobacteria bacterium]|nr:VWA domain-containing protein [Gammaproteobacteria bacterium]MBL6998822.1 VWA domain-containing protein [Gammaproteobacteria bacterium]
MTVQLLRPEWLWMLLPVFLLAWFFWRQQLFSRDWAAVIDAQLLPHLLVGKAQGKSRWPVLLWLLLGVLSVLALSGPVWKKSALPVYKQQSALVVLLDLSSSMDSTDVKPSRLSRARLKLLDLLKMRKEGQTALIAFAATPYTVSPLTDDSETIQSLVNSLTTDIMPMQGSRADLAIEKARELFSNASISRGDILLITDGLSADSMQKIQQLELTGLRVSLLAVGTEQGAPIPGAAGGFIKDAQGSIVVAKTNHGELRTLASRLGGVYSMLGIDDGDLNLYQQFLQSDERAQGHEQTDFKADRWQEEGPWLLLLVTPLVALIFRRGIFLSLLLALYLLPAADSAYALELPEWNSLWKTPDQRAEQALKAGDAEAAASLFQRPDWKAAAHYKAGQYEQAVTELETQHSADSLYNRGNALARMGQLQEALDSYDELLSQQPEHEDARFNREQVEQALNKQQQQQKQNKPQDNSEQQKDKNQQSQQQDSDQPGQQPGQQQGEQSSQDQSAAQSQNAEQNEETLKQAQQQQSEAEKQDEKSEAEQQSQAQAEQKPEQQDEPVEQKEMSEQQQTESLSEQAEAQWLRRIPDDPGGLLRNKFRYQYSRQQQPTREKEPW